MKVVLIETLKNLESYENPFIIYEQSQFVYRPFVSDQWCVILIDWKRFCFKKVWIQLFELHAIAWKFCHPNYRRVPTNYGRRLKEVVDQGSHPSFFERTMTRHTGRFWKYFDTVLGNWTVKRQRKTCGKSISFKSSWFEFISTQRRVCFRITNGRRENFTQWCCYIELNSFIGLVFDDGYWFFTKFYYFKTIFFLSQYSVLKLQGEKSWKHSSWIAIQAIYLLHYLFKYLIVM